jgi:hypothetical protein
MGERKYLVRFDDGSEKECSLAVLRVEKSHASLPPDLPLPSDEVEHRAAVEDVQEVIADQEEEEPLTGLNPNDDESSKSSEEDNNNDGSDDPPNGMPGQLPTEHEQPNGKKYLSTQKQH